jgi:D-alanine-D-alanine ligase
MDSSVTEKIKMSAKKVWNILGMRNYGRIDFRLNENNEAFCLEANTLPGMTNASLLPKSAKYFGLEFPDLIEKIITDVLTK